MLEKAFLVSLATLAAPALAGSFPHDTVISESDMTGPMMKVHTESYIAYSDNMKDSLVAEWTTQKSPMGDSRRFTLNKGGIIYSLDLDSMECTRTNVSSITESVQDPEQFAKNMKKQLNLQNDGKCEGAGLKGVKYKSSFGKMCFYRDMFLLWQEGMGSSTKVTKVVFDKRLPKNKITLPKGVTCTEGPDLSRGLGGLMQPGDPSDQAKDQSEQTQDGGMTQEQATEKAKEAMEALGDWFKRK